MRILTPQFLLLIASTESEAVNLALENSTSTPPAERASALQFHDLTGYSMEKPVLKDPDLSLLINRNLLREIIRRPPFIVVEQWSRSQMREVGAVNS